MQLLPLCDPMACYGVNFISMFRHFFVFCYLPLLNCARSEMQRPKVNVFFRSIYDSPFWTSLFMEWGTSDSAAYTETLLQNKII
jgi:hypothetical protein